MCAYLHPASSPGIWLIEHRPSTYIVDFKGYTDANSESGLNARKVNYKKVSLLDTVRCFFLFLSSFNSIAIDKKNSE